MAFIKSKSQHFVDLKSRRMIRTQKILTLAKWDKPCDLEMRTHLLLITEYGYFRSFSRVSRVYSLLFIPWFSPGLSRGASCVLSLQSIGGKHLAFAFTFPHPVLRWLCWPFCTAGAWHIHSGVLAKATSRECSQCSQLKVFPALLEGARLTKFKHKRS